MTGIDPQHIASACAAEIPCDVGDAIDVIGTVILGLSAALRTYKPDLRNDI